MKTKKQKISHRHTTPHRQKTSHRPLRYMPTVCVPQKSDAPFQSNSDLVIGIDFGTTFTGVAYAHTGSTTADFSKDMRSAVEKISVVKTWPSQTSHFAEKTPTVLSYHIEPPAWGGIVKPDEPLRAAHFKLGLQEDLTKVYGRAGSVALGGYLSDPNWKHPRLPGKSAVDFSSDYLKRVIDHLRTDVLPSRYGETFLQRQQISYVITVPAIWSDKAKDLTRNAAVAAGIPEGALTLISEPEAAALFCSSLCDEVDLKAGDRFLVCDAGGGTVDLISYRVVSDAPFTVEECSVGTGATCGSIYLDRGFESLLKRRFGKSWERVLTPKKLAQLVRYFDSTIKREFNPLDPSSDTEFEIPIAGVGDMEWIGLKDGYLRLSKDDIQSVFAPIFDQILALVTDQISTVAERNGGKTLFLVGGLGSSVYLHKFLQHRLNTLVEVKQPEAGYSAIMRGAVLHKMGMDLVKERVLRTSYGTVLDDEFRFGHDPENRKFMHINGEWRCRGAMYWFMQKGKSVSAGSLVEGTFHMDYLAQDFLTPGPLEWFDELWVCDDPSPPEYDGVTSLRKHCTLRADLRKVPASGVWKGHGPQGGYYTVSFDLGLSFGAGGIEFRILYGGKILGSVECAYF